MTVVLKSDRIKSDAKAKVLNDFVRYVQKNPQYESALLEITGMVAVAEGWKSHVELANYYLLKNDKPLALKHYKSALETDPENFDIIKNILLLQLDLEQLRRCLA